MTTTHLASRSVSRVIDSVRTLEGEGFVVHRPFPSRALDHLDPFMLLDEMGPMDLGPGEAKGAPDHPHRGFETVTYLLHGSMRHKDSQGNSGLLQPGDVQWMTAGAGVIHSEMPEAEFARRGGRMHGFQLWVNLPREDKMIHPRYQDIPSVGIPAATSEDGSVWVRIIAGEAMGLSAVTETRTPILYLHFVLQPGARVEQPIPPGFNAFAYVVEGLGLLGQQRQAVNPHQAAIFADDGNGVIVEAPEASHSRLSVLLIAGKPIKEPIARYGPFVMNTEEEIRQAIEDYRTGRMGAIGL